MLLVAPARAVAPYNHWMDNGAVPVAAGRERRRRRGNHRLRLRLGEDQRGTITVNVTTELVTAPAALETVR